MTLFTTAEGPLGELLLVGEESATTPSGIVMVSLSMPDSRSPALPRDEWQRSRTALAGVVRQLEEYFEGRRTRFELEYRTSGTEFQQRVWEAIDAIPYGTTTTYGALAERLGIPRRQVRVLGAAIGANPLLLVRPCHRVIGADGSMRGYAGGIDRKVALLTHEGALQPMLG
ncbi:methylated-DNA--[protein]-cysteine S-methyltransferase [Streptomyces sp. NPDC003038]|uniref:methylated-DNA--[protein]-cysteine S-methyltransferase n=1 Tax=unclassified Streptomyces TaxID=2593676 RepID=UPI0033AACABC